MPRFDEKSQSYDQFAIIQQEIGQALLQELGNAHFDEALDLGCGTGFIAQQLWQKQQVSQLDLLDQSPTMIAQAKRKLPDGSCQFIITDAEKYQCPKNYDLIISNLAVQWFKDFQGSLSSYYAALKPGGLLLVSTLCQGTFDKLRSCYDELKLKYPGLDYLKSEEIEEQLQALPLEIKNQQFIQSFPSALEFMRQLHAIGAVKDPSSSSGNLRKIIRQLDAKKNTQLNIQYNSALLKIRKPL